MKGHVCIELHNHKTGLRDRIEGNNTVNDFAQQLINYYSQTNSTSVSYTTPLASQIFGGLMLTDKDVEGTFIAGDSKITGIGFQGSSTNSEFIGTYNTAESGIDSTGKIFTHVWDFATSQANGTIKGLGLIHTKGGEIGVGLHIPSSMNINPSQIIYIDEEHNDVYFTKEAAASATIYKQHLSFFNLMLQYTASPNIPLDYNIAIDTGKTIDTRNYAWTYGYDGYIYKYQSLSGRNLNLTRVKVSDLSFDSAGTATFSFPSDIMNYKFALNLDAHRVYCYSSDGNKILMLDTSNNSVSLIDNLIKTVTTAISGDFVTPSIVCTSEGDCYGASSSNGTIIGVGGSRYVTFRINTDGYMQLSYELNGSAATFAKYQGNSSGYYITSSGLIVMKSAYATTVAPSLHCLCTNYNLETAVTKTSSLSMKVTYTLTQP